MSDGRRIGLLGGTFDPIHYGHLDAADAAQQHLGLDDVLFVPSNVPPHRHTGPTASGYDRYALIALAIQDRPRYRASAMELERSGHSYTVDTLHRMQEQGLRPWQMFFIIGSDAFAEIATWHRYPEVLDAANFAVIARPGTSLADAMTRTPTLASRISHEDARTQRTGVFLVEAQTRDVSSTVIRRHLAAGQRIDDLVPAAVARYIATHDLYATVNHLHG
jgi:nicotinate-nucleotide adenylyltransferase